MEVGAHRQRGHHFATIRLHIVQVTNRNVKEGPTELVVNAGNKGFLVHALLIARHHVRLTGKNRIHESRNILRLELQVGGIEHQHVPMRMQVPGSQCLSDPPLRTMAHRAKERILLREFLKQIPAAVSGPVINHHHFIASGFRAYDGVTQLEKEREIPSFILGRHKDADVDRGGAYHAGRTTKRTGGDGHSGRSECETGWTRATRACAYGPEARRAGRDTWPRFGVQSGHRSAGESQRLPDP